MTDTPATSGLTPYININGVAAAMEFYTRAFAAIERARNQMGSDNPHYPCPYGDQRRPALHE